MTEADKKTRLLLWGEIRHFTPDEFDSPDEVGSGLNMNIEFVKLLDQGRSETGFPWTINSGVRTEKHNKKVGGKGPEHCKGLAVDVAADSHQAYKIIEWIYKVGIKRWGFGDGYVHIGFSFKLPQEVAWGYYPKKKIKKRGKT